MRISDWSSDVCSSDLAVTQRAHFQIELNRSNDAFAVFLREANWAHGLLGRRVGCASSLEFNADALEQVNSYGQWHRSEERRVGKEYVSTCRYRWLQYN